MTWDARQQGDSNFWGNTLFFFVHFVFFVV
jgi:hypothetical protein